MIGHFLSDEALAAVSSTSAIYSLLIDTVWCVNALGIAVFFGRKNDFSSLLRK